MPRPTKKENLPRLGAGGEKKVAEDLKRKGGDTPANASGRADKVARKLDFGSMG